MGILSQKQKEYVSISWLLNNAGTKIGMCMYLLELVFLFIPDINPGVDMLDHIAVFVLVFFFL